MAEKDKVYKCLNPVGISAGAVDLHPLAPRLDTLDGKNILLNIPVVNEGDITIPLERRVQSDYPNVNWKIRKSAAPISDEEMKTCDGLIQGVAW